MTQSPPSPSTVSPIFCAAFELSASRWRVAFTDGHRHRQVSIDAGDFERLTQQIQKARQQFKLGDDVPLNSCYEAGRDGFWIHRRLLAMGVRNLVVDSASIEVSRRAKRSKTDTQDAESLSKLLVRHVRGERRVWSIAQVPSVEMEDARRVDRERGRLTKEKTAHQARIRSLLALKGVPLKHFKELEPALARLRRWNPHLVGEIERQVARLNFVLAQLRELDKQCEQLLEEEKLPWAKKVSQLQTLKGFGRVSATSIISDFFGWREFKNGKQVGAAAGLTPTAFSSGSINREQGISKAGSRRMRRIMVEVAWTWLRYQPQSALSRWFESRFAKNGGRSRRVGIVALARKLLVAVWQFVENGVIPEGAIMKA